MNKKTMYANAVVSLLLLFTACDMKVTESERSSGYDGKAAVRIKIEMPGVQARTVTPEVALQDMTTWRLWGGKQGDAETLQAEFFNTEEMMVYLDPATWRFTLRGYKDDDVILTGAIAEQNISLAGTNVLAFTLAPVLEGQGIFNIVINIPDEAGITAAAVFKDGIEETSVEPIDNRIVFEETYPAGDYYFSVRLYKDSDMYGVVSEVAQVRANLRSEKTYTLTREDLNLTYIITYHLWDTETETGYYRHTDATIVLDAPTRTGYAFGGWYEDEGFSGDAVAEIPANSMGDKDFYAKWTAQYTVTFDADGGSPATQTLTVNSGDSVGSASGVSFITYSSVSGGEWTLLDDGRRRSPAIGENSVTKARISFASAVANTSITIQLDVSSESGYDFAFISTLDNASATYNSGYYSGSVISGTQSVTVTIPVPTTGSHFIDIGYGKDGSVNSGSDCAWFKVTNAGGSTMPSDPTRNGYTFGGWYTQQNGSGTEFTASTTVTANITVYAKWTAQYTVTFNAEDGNPTMQTRTASNGGSVGIENMPPEPVKTHCIFDGWYTSTNGNGSQFTATTPVTRSLTVYAKWTIIQYTVTFYADGGSPETQTRTVNGGDSVGSANLPSDPIMSGYSFDGWYTLTNGGGSQFSATTPVTGNMTLYAKWLPQYTITFNADGGSPATQTRMIISGDSVGDKNMPTEPTKSDYAFGGWWTSTGGGGSQFTYSTTIIGNITVYAKWTVKMAVPASTLQAAFDWLDSNAVEEGAYTIAVSANEIVAPKTLSYSGKNVGITLNGGASERIITLSTIGSLFTIESGVALTLGDNITLQGMSSNTASLIRVNSGGTFVMSGGTISGNTTTASYSYGGGVYVASSGAFTLTSGTISGNTASGSTYGCGGGVYVANDGTFTMSGGTISNNTTAASGISAGGGVYVASSGTFTMNGGIISGNTASGSTGGGVYAYGTFIKQSGGIIYGSNASDGLKNTAGSGASGGPAVYGALGGKERNSTAGEGVTLDSRVSGTAGGWE